MSKIDNLYSAANYYNNSVQKKQKERNANKAVKNEKAEATEKIDQTNQVKLSDKAQAVLDRLKEKYGNNERSFRMWCAFWAPNKTLESKNEKIYFCNTNF